MPTSRIETDVLIIGTGPGGATFARLLASQGKNVVMVDAGPKLRTRPGEHLLNCFRYQHQPNLSLDEMLAHREICSIPGVAHDITTIGPSGGAYNPPQGRRNFENTWQNPNTNMPNAGVMYAVGGMFGIWSCYAPDPTPEERTPLIPAEDWDRTLAIARRLFNVHLDAFEPSAVNRALLKVLAENGHQFENVPMAAAKRPVQRSTPPPKHGSNAHYVDWTGVDTILGPLVDATGRCAPNLTILEEHRAEGLVPRDGTVPTLALGTQRIDHAIVRDLRTLELKEIHADCFVVAAGAFFTPRLLWQSGIRPPALGCYLADNTVATCQLVLNDAVIKALKADPENPARDELIPVAWYDPAPKCGLHRTPENPWIGHINRAGYTMAYDMTTDVRLTLELTWYGTVTPQATNRIVFDDHHLDRFGMPQITIEFRLGHDDAQRAARMLDDLAATAPAIGSYVPLSRPPFTKGPTLQPLGTALHIMGTTRMGKDGPETSVVDPDCKVWGFDNLYLGGNGVIPNEVASNCSLTACAIGVRAAWKLLGCPIEDLEREVGITAAEPPAPVAAAQRAG